MTLPELSNTAFGQRLRIPDELDVPISFRIRRLLDTEAMQRLKRISQLGLVSQVYPGAVHSRFEHSLGVYRLARIVLQHLLSTDPKFCDEVTEREAKVFLLAALLHDVGHWPYCHPIEDMRLAWVPSHEAFARRAITQGEISNCVQRDWNIDPGEVASFLDGSKAATSNTPSMKVLGNLLSGPIDIDKMDYLQRDSHHAGVPYGKNFDVGRLISSLRVAQDRASIAITDKGKTAAEMMVFARYVMFSEVYWHHTVRSATAMLQRLVYRIFGSGVPSTTVSGSGVSGSGVSDSGVASKSEAVSAEEWLKLDDSEFEQLLLARSQGNESVFQLSDGLFGRRRSLYKRLAQFSLSDDPEVFSAFARRPFDELTKISESLGTLLSQQLTRPLNPDDLIIDAPPVKLEVQFRLKVETLPSQSRLLAELSPVVNALATDQFDNHVKRVRIFVHPSRRDELRLDPTTLKRLVLQSAELA